MNTEPTTTHSYPTVDESPSFPAIENDVLSYWDSDKTFATSITNRDPGTDGSNEYVFYDGPPFANGLPHYGHLLTGYVKDAVPRYQTMRGRRVERRFGWDTHGMPAEVTAEKELHLNGKPDILKLGIAAFNEACRSSVLRYTHEWERYVTRQARWVDFANDYKTLDLSYMESVMWAFKTLWDKGYVYEGERVLAYCWRCETPLSATETKMDDVYKARQDPAVTVWFALETGERAMAWTTTPWTLPSNLALAVNPEVDYAVVAHTDGHRYLLAEARLGHYAREFGDEPVVEQIIRGSELVGRRYRPMFGFFAGTPNAHQVLPADYVTTDDGTGIVHIAPAFGEEDKLVTDAAGIPVRNPVDAAGKFTAEVPPYQGQMVLDANKSVIKDLKANGTLVRQETYDHSVPHCWRCDSPLIYRAVSSWFVEVTAFRDRMVELNQDITWVPSHTKDGIFGNWLANARDWSISRNRFWGSPIPVWKSDDPAYPRIDVYGSLDDIERDFGVRPTDLHRPYVDDLVRPNPDDPTGKSTMRRVPEVLDCWFESGSMPFAQVHYPFENKDWFEHHYPGDFIVEYISQTRGWFYTLHVLATALFDRPSFRTCMSHGIVLGDDGRKMSKSLQNYPDVSMAFETYGSDAMRWLLLSSPVLRGGDMSVTETGIRDQVRHVVLPMWNTWKFLTLYANAENKVGTLRMDSPHELDRYILAKLRSTLTVVTDRMDAVDLFAACGAIREFIDVLTNWYVRRSRDRFWTGEQDAIDTLHTVLLVLSQMSAPLLPLTTEAIFRGLTNERSVHLTDWPSLAELPEDNDLVAAMDQVRNVCSAALGVRKTSQLRVRLPLNELTVAHPQAMLLKGYEHIVADELNVKNVTLTEDVAAHGSYVLSAVPRALGPRLGKNVQKVINAIKAGDWSETDGVVTAGGVALEPGEYELRLQASAGAGAMPGGVVVLDTTVTPELEAEGTARDVIRAVQQARKDAGLQVSDRIALTLGVPDALRGAVEKFQSTIAAETLATTVAIVVREPGAGTDSSTEAALSDGTIISVAVAVDVA